ncbi:unnamed protein product [Rhodiola kirilowii]
MLQRFTKSGSGSCFPPIYSEEKKKGKPTHSKNRSLSSPPDSITPRSSKAMSYYNQGQPPIRLPPSQGYPLPPPKDAYPPAGYPDQAYTQQYAPPQQYQQPPPPHQQKSGPGFVEGW